MLNGYLNLKTPLLMAILNVTSDSFYDGGKYLGKENLKKRIETIIKQGADIIDIGAQSTFVDRKEISIEEEISKVLEAVFLTKNYLKNLSLTANRLPLISIDTYRYEVAKNALQNGAHMINDVTGLRADPQMAEVIAQFQCPIVIMYAKEANARTTKDMVEYDDIILTLKVFFEERLSYCTSQGISLDKIILDPGMGFFVSANPKYSFEILDKLGELKNYFNLPMLVGTSRKSFLSLQGKLSASERLEGSLATAAIALYNGANIIRTHDVFETRIVMDTMTGFTYK